MNIVVIGLNHRTANVEMREKLACGGEKLPQALKALISLDEITEGIILSTCNRVEIYAVTDDSARGVKGIKNFLSIFHNIPLEFLEGVLYSYEGDDAVRHIFRVASSLDSMVLGEPQILGQMKDAYEKALSHHTTGVILNHLMKKAISVAKRVRTETKIAENAVSISYAAVELAKKIFEDINTKTAMLLGAGDMAELAARHLLNSGVKKMIVSNRTYERALDLASDFKGKAIRWEDFLREMLFADIVICSTGAPNYVLTKEQARKMMKDRKHKSIFIIDISVPRNIDPEINGIDDIYLYDIDDLQGIVDSNILERKKEAKAAEEIVRQAVKTFVSWERSLEAVPTIVDIRNRAESIRKAEIEKFMNKLNGMNEKDKEIVEALTNSIVNKLLHPSLTALKKNTEDTEDMMNAIYLARRFFGLDKEEDIEKNS